MAPLIKLRNCVLIYKTKLLVTTKRLISDINDWVEASSLILVAKRDSNLASNSDHSNDDDCDYRVLLVKRSDQMSMLSNHYVFPGGHSDFEDFRGNWIANCFGDQIKRTIEITGPRAPVIVKSITREKLISNYNGNNSCELLSTDFALRIAAIRETFEETGILLSTRNMCNTGVHLIDSYRKKLLNNELKFSDLCNEVSVCPDVWSVYEWSNWLSPLMGTKRHHTMFYIAFIDDEINVNLDEQEMSHFTWCSLKEMLNKYYSCSDTVLATPQVYELTRLLNVNKYSVLKKFAANRQQFGLQRYLPKMIYFIEGSSARMVDSNIKISDVLGLDYFITLLPGDELYNYDVTNADKNEMNTSKMYHRSLYRDQKFFMQCTIDMPFGHLSLVSYNTF